GLDAVCAGLAGFYPPWHRAELRAAIREKLSVECSVLSIETGALTPNTQHPTPILVPDLEIAWAGGLAARAGVVLVGGTGSVAYGRNAAGRGARAGGWGYLAGDEGSAYWIGREALAAVAVALA